MSEKNSVKELKKIIALILIAIMTVASLAACGSKAEQTDAESEKEAVAEKDAGEESSENKAAEDEKKSAETQADSSTYKGVLTAEKQAIEDVRSLDINENEMDKNVALYDLNGDGTEELIFFKSHGVNGDDLHVYTMKGGTAVECVYDVDTDATLSTEDSPSAFAVIHAGGPSSWMVYTGNEPGVFYAARYNSSSMMNCYSIKYRMSDGTVKSEGYVHNAYGNDPSIERDDYDINGNAVSESKGAREFKNHRDDYGTLLMYGTDAGLLDNDFKVFENLKSDIPIARSVDDILAQLD